MSIDTEKKLLEKAALNNEDTRQNTERLENLYAIGGEEVELGYGGYNYNAATAADKNKMVNDSKRLASDINYRNAEIARAEQVIENRKAKGVDVSQQVKYKSSLETMTLNEQKAADAAADKKAAEEQAKAEKAAMMKPPTVYDDINSFDSWWSYV